GGAPAGVGGALVRDLHGEPREAYPRRPSSQRPGTTGAAEAGHLGEGDHRCGSQARTDRRAADEAGGGAGRTLRRVVRGAPSHAGPPKYPLVRYEEERTVVYRQLLSRLMRDAWSLSVDRKVAHLRSEMIKSIFD